MKPTFIAVPFRYVLLRNSRECFLNRSDSQWLGLNLMVQDMVSFQRKAQTGVINNDTISVFSQRRYRSRLVARERSALRFGGSCVSLKLLKENRVGNVKGAAALRRCRLLARSERSNTDSQSRLLTQSGRVNPENLFESPFI
jgi:hypothetical protein